MLRARVATAGVLAPVLLAGVWLLPTAALAVVLAVPAALAAWEWAGLIGVAGRAAAAGLVLGFLATLVPAWLALEAGWADPGLVYAAAGLWLVILLGVALHATGRLPRLGAVVVAGLGWLTLGGLWLAMTYLHGHTAWGPFWITFLLVLVWGADTGAYFAGRAWGRRRLAASLSPGKTWEGVAGGLAAALIAGATLVLVLDPARPSWPLLLAISVATVAAAILGDLFESALKRQRGVKDSGGILPGHGGLLDRIDSLMAAAPILAAGVAWWQSTA